MILKKVFIGLGCTLLCLLHSFSASASHIFGGELLYTAVNDTTYALNLTFYGDCSAYSAIFHSLDSATPLIYIYKNDVLYDSVRLKADTIELDVSPVCPHDIDSTTCYGGTLPGVKKFVYTDTVYITSLSTKWSFIFKGDMGYSDAAGRSVNITNIISPGTSLIQLEADLNNVLGHNSSPEYSTIPTPFYCINVNEEYNQGAIDPDGDSLAFQMVQAYNGQTGNPVNYVFPYTATSPLATSPGNFHFTNVNGEMTFTPDLAQDALIVTQVAEYRGSLQVGSSEREMTFIVLSNYNGIPPSLHISSIYGGVSDNNIINICQGTPLISFILTLNNPDGDSTHLTYTNLPAGAVLDTFDNGSPNPSISFSWNTGAIAPGLYTFYVTVKNNHCPISNTSTIAYTINIATPPVIAISQLSPTDCIQQAYMQYILTGGFLPRNIYIVKGGDTVKTYTDTTGIILDSLPAGNYLAIVSSDSLCTSYQIFSISDSGDIPLTPLTESMCLGDATGAINFPIAGTGATLSWFLANGTPITSAPTPNTNIPGTYTWYVTEHYIDCSSLPDTVTAIVRPLPVPEVPLPPATICLGDTLYLIANGDATFTWTPQNNIYTNNNNQLYAIADAPITFTITAVDKYGCTDTVTLPYSNIQQCCNFVYPNAFTPNNDGKNDGFRVLTYGNMLYYQLSIYNRWGDRVFYTEDSHQYWDGTYSGKVCDNDTYFYYFKGTCLTGHSEQHKGDVTLVR